MYVGGIIGVVCYNGFGGDGVVMDIKFMLVCVVLDGDELDKDVVLVICYVVDNGVFVINMFFGKVYFVYQKEVYEVLKYVDFKGVLFVYVVGNDNENVDVNDNFLMNNYSFQLVKLNNYLSIGVFICFLKGELVVLFFNYGQICVDVFVLGLEIYNIVL